MARKVRENPPGYMILPNVYLVGFNNEQMALAHSLLRQFSIDDCELIALYQILERLRHLYTQSAPQYADGPATSKFMKTATAMVQAFNDLNEFEKSIVEDLFKVTTYGPPPKVHSIAGDLSRHWAFRRKVKYITAEQMLRRVEDASQWLLLWKRKPGAERETPIVAAVTLLHKFWHISLGREFLVDLKPGVDALSNPDDEFCPQSPAAKFCCAVLRAACKPDIQGNSVRYAMIEVHAAFSQRKVEGTKSRHVSKRVARLKVARPAPAKDKRILTPSTNT